MVWLGIRKAQIGRPIKQSSNSPVNDQLFILIMCCAVISTIMSQFAGTLFNILFYILWLFLAGYALTKRYRDVALRGYAVFFLVMFAIVGFLCSLSYLYTGESGYLSGLFQALIKVSLMYYIGYIGLNQVNSRLYRPILYTYIISTVIYEAWVFITFFGGWGAWLDTMQYSFPSKNSFGQISGVAILVSVAFSISGSEMEKRIFPVASILMMVGIVFAQCRTALIAVCLGLVVMLAYKKKIKLALLIIIFGILVSVYLELSSGFISHLFFIDKYGSSANIDQLSSGRGTLWTEALVDISHSPIIGLGYYYVDNFYLNLFANLGLFSGLVFIIIWITRIIVNLRVTAPLGVYAKWIDCDSLRYDALLAGLTVFYLIESLMEGLPPFGPGACSFIFWLLCGSFDSQRLETMEAVSSS